LILLSPGATAGAANARSQKPEFAWRPGSFLVRLHRPLVNRTADGSFSPQTGNASADALISEAGVIEIESALTVSAGTSRYPESSRRWGLDRIYRFHVGREADIENLVLRFGATTGVDYAEPDYLATAEGTATTDPVQMGG